MAGPLISFLTDFGGGSAPAVCRGVIWSIAPDARILDIDHHVRRHAIRDGAFLLSRVVPFLPVGVHLAVVDPGVGTPRRPVGVRAWRGDFLVGPDNGLLLLAADALGGVAEARYLIERSLMLPAVSSTFHGRDLFAPIAAHLATGVPFERVGPPVDPADLVGLGLPAAVARPGGLDTAVLLIDPFGNARLAGQPADLEAVAGPLEPGRRFRVVVSDAEHEVPWFPTFGEVAPGDVLLYEDADYAGLALAVNQGSAAERFDLAPDRPVRIEPIDPRP